jgi:predicted ATPase
MREALSSATLYHSLDVGPRSPIKLPQAAKPTTVPGPDGEDLVSFLFTLRESDRDRYRSILDSVRAAFPGFEEFGFPLVASGTFAMTWKERGHREPLFMNELSEGTLRFLWLASLLQSPALPAVTLIDEPEVSLHPELLSLLAELIRAASRRSQIVIATHSDRLVRFLKPNEIVAMDLQEDGAATAQWADTLDLDKWLDEYTLDEVWGMGRMGARA